MRVIVKGRVNVCVKEQLCREACADGAGWLVWVDYRGDFLPLIYWWERHKAPWHFGAQHIIPTFLFAPNGMSLHALEMWKGWLGRERKRKEKRMGSGKTVGLRVNSKWWWKRNCWKDLQQKQTQDFPLKLNTQIKFAPNRRASPSLSAPPVDVKQYNYALIYCIVDLSMHELLSLQREDPHITPPPPPPHLPVTLSLSPFLIFRIFKCQLCLCGLSALGSFDVFGSSVSVLCVWVGADQ